MSNDIINALHRFFGDNVNYLPYSMANVAAFAGNPYEPIVGLQYIWARHDEPQTTLVMSLNSKGAFLANNNKSGTIEIAVLGESFSAGKLQIADFTGIPFPIFVTDTTTGGTSYVLGSACRRVDTPTWRRNLAPSLNIYTFATERLFISDGVRLQE